MLAKREIEVASENIRGIDKDEFLSKVSKAYMALVGDGRGGVFCENSLQCPQEWEPRLGEKVKLGAFDVVLTNPPFGNRIVVKGEALLSQYEFGYRWKRVDGKWQKTSQLFEEQPPQLLFLERSLQLLKQGWREVGAG